MKLFLQAFIILAVDLYGPIPLTPDSSEVRTGQVYSIEWLASSADFVVRAKIEDLSGDGPGTWFTIRATAMETLKGDSTERLLIRGSVQHASPGSIP